ncbi:MAG: glycosyltransferase family 2 protein [Proteobacteria bacterium]|nr:MAG: glycosyltransferase family 2 protein [Pseudomonadota bacterium]
MYVSVIIPAKNEGSSIGELVGKIRDLTFDKEIIVVDDGSTDETADIAEHQGARVIRHPYSIGNGAAVKDGARAARGDILVFMDGDGQHDPDDIERLLARLGECHAMVVGARDKDTHASRGRRGANAVYNLLASYMSGHSVRDLTSGFRAVRAAAFKEYLYLLPNGFSYPTTITMAFFRAGLPVAYEPIRARDRVGKSHIRVFRDGTRFLVIIFKIGTLYSPLKLFAPLSLAFFLTGIGWYGYTFATLGRFTNMSALLITGSFLTFAMGLISEQITALMYRDSDQRH